jgi:hypothetical protein
MFMSKSLSIPVCVLTEVWQAEVTPTSSFSIVYCITRLPCTLALLALIAGVHDSGLKQVGRRSMGHAGEKENNKGYTNIKQDKTCPFEGCSSFTWPFEDIASNAQAYADHGHQ